MYQIQIDVSEIQLVDKGTHFVLSIPTKVYSSTNPPLSSSSIHHHQLNNSAKSQGSKSGSPTNPNSSSSSIELANEPPQIKHTLRLKNAPTNHQPQSIQQQISKLQTKYEELFRSRIKDAQNQTQIQPVAKKEKESNDEKKQFDKEIEPINNNRNQGPKRPQMKNNIYSNRNDAQQNMSNMAPNSSPNSNYSNPFAKNTLAFPTDKGYSSSTNGNRNSTNGPPNTAFNSNTNKNPFLNSVPNSLYSGGNNQILQNPVSLAQGNSFLGNSNTGSTGIFDVSSSRTSKTSSRFKKGPTFA